MHENRMYKGILLYEWLIEKAKEMGIHGGSEQFLAMLKKEKLNIFFVKTSAEYGILDGT